MPKRNPIVGTTSGCVMNVSRKTTVPKSTNPMICLKVSIHAPGLGKNAIKLGKCADQEIRAGHPQADGHKDGIGLGRRLSGGPGQRRGQERSRAGSGQNRGDDALENAPANPSFSASSTVFPRPTKPGMGISHTPRKLSPMAKTTAIKAMLNPL